MTAAPEPRQGGGPWGAGQGETCPVQPVPRPVQAVDLWGSAGQDSLPLPFTGFRKKRRHFSSSAFRQSKAKHLQVKSNI